jgi:hypothetical protein
MSRAYGNLPTSEPRLDRGIWRDERDRSPLPAALVCRGIGRFKQADVASITSTG